MRKARKYLTAGVMFSAAAVAAQFMQSSGTETKSAGFVTAPALSASAATAEEPAKPRVQRLNEVVVVASALAPTTPTEFPTSAVEKPVVTQAKLASAPLPPKDTLMPKPLPQVGAALADRMAETVTDPAAKVADGPERNEFGLTCGPILSASAREAAIVALTLTAPCRGGQELTVYHAGLEFSGRLNKLGTYTVDVPAFEAEAEAEFRVDFDDGAEAFALVEVENINDIDRVALLSDGQSGLQIHALEFGADYDDAGHIWSGTPGTAETAALEGGGYLMRLGDETTQNSKIAEVYTFPDFAQNRDGVVRLSVEAEVTAYNCDKEVAGHTMERVGGAGVTEVSLTVAIPDCTAIGEYLVLKNLLRDLKIASN